MIAFYAEETQLPAVRQEAVREWVRTVARSYGKKVGDISYIFCSDEKILAVNREFLQHDYYTDIITFDYTSGEKIAGDLFISLDTVRTNAEKFGQPTTRSCIAPLSMASCIYVASMIKGQESGRSWRRMRTRRWRSCRRSADNIRVSPLRTTRPSRRLNYRNQ